MKRLVLNLLTALSLLLCVAVAMLWVTSHWTSRGMTWAGKSSVVGFDSSRGRLAMVLVTGRAGPAGGSPGAGDDSPISFRALPADDLEAGFRSEMGAAYQGRFGFGCGGGVMHGTPMRVRVAVAPHWLSVLAAAAAPALWLVRRHRRRCRSGQYLCPLCGYDLRATPDRCPECGTPA